MSGVTGGLRAVEENDVAAQHPGWPLHDDFLLRQQENDADLLLINVTIR